MTGRGPAIALFAVMLMAGKAFAADAIGIAEFSVDHWTGGLIANSAFTPGKDSRPAHEQFTGTLTVGETEMSTMPATFKSASVLGKNPRLFPAVQIPFFTEDGDLVPSTQDVIRSGSLPGAQSYWDIIVQPGRVWSQPGDDGWSRAAFPFALMHSIEGETHNGLATFLYKGNQVSKLRFQIVQQTAPFYVTDHFSAAGQTQLSFTPDGIDNLEALRRTYKASLHDAIAVRDWSQLERKVGAKALDGFDGDMNPAEIVMSGLDYQGTFYLKQCNSAAGPLPWCDRVRFGVWSATKSLATATALLRLAQKFGPDVFELKIRDYVLEAAAAPEWQAVRFGDAINMATGVGTGSDRRDPNDIFDGYTDTHYAAWYEAHSMAEKVPAVIANGRPYPWGPGKVARYRDQDMFILGVAMDAYLKSKEGPAADIWTMLEDEVFRPVGIHYAPINRTIEQDGRRGQPLMAFGYYPTIGDMVKIARLYQARGEYRGKQLLYRPRIDALMYGPTPRGLPTGVKNRFGGTTYFNAFWHAPYDSPEGCKLYLPHMQGFGGNLVAPMPGGLTGIRLANANDGIEAAADDATGMAVVANRLTQFCN
jgi:hypothetical protein